jgi:hypothetical protein
MPALNTEIRSVPVTPETSGQVNNRRRIRALPGIGDDLAPSHSILKQKSAIGDEGNLSVGHTSPDRSLAPHSTGPSIMHERGSGIRHASKIPINQRSETTFSPQVLPSNPANQIGNPNADVQIGSSDLLSTANGLIDPDILGLLERYAGKLTPENIRKSGLAIKIYDAMQLRDAFLKYPKMFGLQLAALTEYEADELARKEKDPDRLEIWDPIRGSEFAANAIIAGIDSNDPAKIAQAWEEIAELRENYISGTADGPAGSILCMLMANGIIEELLE